MAEQPTPPRTSSAVEDYLERISELIKTKGYARVVDIAAELKISQASVTTMVQRLDDQGLVKYEKYRGMVLTPETFESLEKLNRYLEAHPEVLAAIKK